MRRHRPRTPLLLLLGGGVLLGVTFLLLLRGERTASPRASETEMPVVPEVRTYTDSDTVRRGDTLAGLLFRNRMDMQQITRVLQEVRARDYFSPRRIKPGQVFDFTRNEAGEIVRLTCRISPEQAYVIEIAAGRDSLRSYPLAIETELRVRKLSGPVLSTYEEAVLAAGGRLGLAGKISDIFSGDIDFFTEVRRGDSFSLLVEERYVEDRFVGYGEVLYGWYEGEEASAVCVYYRPPEGKGGYYDLEGKSLRRRFLRSPLTYRRISSYFTNRRFHPILKRYRPHHGVDYAAPRGTPVSTVGDGVVVSAGWSSGYGKMVEIRHSPTHTTRYGHLSRIAKGIRKGARVRQGEKIGSVGSTGLATGPNLHYEMRVDGRPINPLRMRRMPTEPIPPAQLTAFLEYAEEMASVERKLEPGALLEIGAPGGMLLARNVGDASSTTVD